MKLRYLFIVTMALALAGCGGNDNGSAETPEAAAGPAGSDATSVSQNPDEILVEVNGKKLTRGDAEELVGYRIAAVKSRIPAERMDQVRQQMLDNSIDQFVMRTLLLEEADSLKIGVTPDDEKQAFDKIRTSLPPGLTPEDVMKKSPLGEERMKEEVMVGIRINKLLDAHLAQSVTISDADIDEFIEQNKARMTIPDTAHARHILISMKPEDDEKAKAEKKKALEDIRQQLLDGGDFAALATEHSDCPSAQKGGDLGMFPRGRMVPEFEEAAFTQPTNAIGPVVETKFGYHVIQVLNRSEAGQMPRERVEQLLKNRSRQQATAAYVEELKAKAKITDSRQPVMP